MNLQQLVTVTAWQQSPPEICIDFDDTLVFYKNYRQTGGFGAPDPEALKLVRMLKKSNCIISILTSRPPPQHERIRLYLKNLGLTVFKVTNEKSPSCSAFLDNKAVHWDGDADKAFAQIQGVLNEQVKK